MDENLDYSIIHEEIKVPDVQNEEDISGNDSVDFVTIDQIQDLFDSYDLVSTQTLQTSLSESEYLTKEDFVSVSLCCTIIICLFLLITRR